MKLTEPVGRWLLSLILIVVSTISYGQGTGLVLSGGGAKGLAHIGVIRALEESNIKIDYVAGTSMGAIVGSLYAMGYSADEMEKLVTSEEFIRWSTGTIDPRYRFNYKRTEDDASMFTIGIKREKDGTRPNIPAHLVPSGVIDFAILELTSGANAVSGNNFDSLMIPFRCIASDVYNKKAVVMRRGNLGHAVKASMSYPLYFEPVTIDSVLLFDGGIYNNFPFDVLVEDFNPDFIIGSKVANRTPKPGKDDLMLQLENMIMQETNYVIPDSVGLVIEMKFENVSLLDFQMADSLINDGYRKTKNYINQILPHVEITSQELLEERRLRYRQSLPDTLFENIFINGVSDRQEQYITNLISKQEKTFDINQLKREYFKLLSEENIARSYPEARYNPERGTYDLLLDVELKDTYSLSAGGLISLSTYNQVFMGFNYYSLSDIFNMFSANVYLGQYYSSFNIAHRIVVPQRKSLLVDFSLTGNRWNYFTNEAPRLFSANSPSYAVRNERSFRAGIGFPAGNNSIFRTALSFCWIDDDYYQVTNFQAGTVPDKSEYFYAGAKAGFEGNTLNRRQFASRGNKFSADLSYHTGFEFFREGLTDTVFDPEDWTDQQGWFTVRIRNENYNHTGRRFVIGSLVDITVSNMRTGNNFKSTLINAYKFEPTLFSKQLFGRFMRSNSYIGLGLMPVLEYSKDLNLRGGVYMFAPVRDIVDDPSGVKYGDYFTELRGVAEFAVVYHSPVGPFSAGLNYFSHEKNKVFYFLNFGYILFNSKGLE